MVFTAPLAVVRVDVHNDATWETRSISLAERSKYLYREDDLKRWVEPIYELAWQADQVYARMNNCYSDYEAGTEHYIVN
jgi:uncharacterized protein YecE (DUF72 family)